MRGIEKLKNKKLIFATHNIGKIKEFEQLFSGIGIDFLNLSSFKIEDEPIENGLTFSQNAEIKIDYYFNRIKESGFEFKPETYLMSEDSGIEIKYLNGDPGVKSARYGGDITAKERNELILSKLKGVSKIERKARYYCCIKVLNFFTSLTAPSLIIFIVLFSILSINFFLSKFMYNFKNSCCLKLGFV